MPDYWDVFAKNLDTLTQGQQENLQQKRVCVAGCGGLGGYVIEQLVRLGVGHIHCFDPDVFSIKILLGLPSSLAGSCLYVDLKNNEWVTVG